LTISGTAGRVSVVLGRESVPPTAGAGNPFTGNGAVTVGGSLVSAWSLVGTIASVVTSSNPAVDSNEVESLDIVKNF
jgi:hypothetical protein